AQAPRPRLGTVPLAPGPARAGAARRRGDVPSVRAVRLADGPPAPAGRPPAPAAVTPVPLPVLPPAVQTPPPAVPIENRPEEPQP
ncbi:histidinol-phosphate aminotransferase family protein, partial [Streptomyces cinereoruber]